MSKDAITLLKNDHRTVEKLFERFRHGGDADQERLVVEEIIRELSVHAAVEEEILYPVVSQALPEGERLAEEARNEHRAVKEQLAELDRLEPSDERFAPRVRTLIADVNHHIQEEERELFPRLKRALPRKRLRVMAEAMAVARLVAPTHPHPRLPDTPPANVIAGAAVAVVDRARDAAREARRKATGAPTKPAARKRTTTKKTAAKKAPARKKTTAKRSAAKKSTTKTAPARKKTTAKRATAKRTPAKKAPARKKATAAKKATAKRTTTRKAAPRRAA